MGARSCGCPDGERAIDSGYNAAEDPLLDSCTVDNCPICTEFDEPDEDILNRFEPVYVTDETAGDINYLKHKFRGMAAAIEVYSLPSREQSLALTALEEASHWANRAVAKAAVQPKAN